MLLNMVMFKVTICDFGNEYKYKYDNNGKKYKSK